MNWSTPWIDYTPILISVPPSLLCRSIASNVNQIYKITATTVGTTWEAPHRRPTESDLKKNFRRLMKDLKIRVLPLLLQINWQTLYINDNQTIVISREKRFQHFFRYFCLIFIKSDFSINKIFKSFYNFINFLQISYKRIFRISFYHFFIMSLKFIFIRKIDIKMDFLFEFFVWFSYLWVKAMDGTDIWFDLLFTSFEFTWNVLNVYIFS